MNEIQNHLQHQIEMVLQELVEIKSIIRQQECFNATNDSDKAMQYLNAIRFIKEKGISMSKSKLYKLTSSNEIPYRKAGNRLIFYPYELEKWCNCQVINPQEHLMPSNLLIIKSAQKKYNNKIKK